jgi:hypothetical protein
MRAAAIHAHAAGGSTDQVAAEFMRRLPLSGLTHSVALPLISGRDAGRPNLWIPFRLHLVDRARALRFADRVGRYQLGLPRNAINQTLADPARTARLAYLMLRRVLRDDGLGTSSGSMALFVLGLASAAIALPQRCILNCFRLCYPTRMRCPWHARSKTSSNDADVQRNVRTSSRLENFEWSRFDTEGPSPGGIERSAHLLRFLLWPTQTKEALFWRSRLEQALLEAPQVAGCLSKKFTTLDLRRRCEELRLVVDTMEYDVQPWIEKIAAAETELSIQQRPQRKIEGRTLERVALAKALLAQGVSRKDIAVRIDISLANLKKILARYGRS